MPRRFRNFLRKKRSSNIRGGSSRGGKRYNDNHGIEQYGYDIDYDHHGRRKRKSRTQSLGKKRSSWSFGNNSNKKMMQMHRSSQSLGDAEVNGRMITLLESDSGASEEDDYLNDDIDDDMDSTDGLQELDRACVRLDGIEVYAIVSALTCATSISCFDNYDPTPLGVILKERAAFTLISELLYYVSGALGMMTGLHATLIFSLVTMYGRTALGINRDDAFNEFFSNTGPARFNGFRSFKYSLYCFMTQLCFLIGNKFFFEPLRPLVLLGTLCLAFKYLYVDSESVLLAAGVIYSAPPPPPPPEEDTEPAFDRRSSLTQMKRRASIGSSMKNKSFSLSTRAFGVDKSIQNVNNSSRRGSLILSNTSTFGLPQMNE